VGTQFNQCAGTFLSIEDYLRAVFVRVFAVTKRICL